MTFTNFLLYVDDYRFAEMDDFQSIIKNGNKYCKPERQKNYYKIEKEILSDRFFWMSCEYGDAETFNEFVVDQQKEEEQPNPRTKDQVELNNQFFACYDTQEHFLFISDISKRHFLEFYFSDTTQNGYQIKNIYTSVDEFCQRVQTIKEFRYTQDKNIFSYYSGDSDIFKQVGDIWGLSEPDSLQIKIGCGNIPIRGGGFGLIDRIRREHEKNAFKDVIIIGKDEHGVEESFDFSSLLKRFEIHIRKNENGRYNVEEVKQQFFDTICHV